MTLTIKWWMVSILLAVFPIVYSALKRQTDYDLNIDVFLVTAVCWSAAVGLTVGKLL